MTFFPQKHCVLVCCGTTVDKSAQISADYFLCAQCRTQLFLIITFPPTSILRAVMLNDAFPGHG